MQDATRMVLSTSLVFLLLAVGVSGYISVSSSPTKSPETVTYAAWYSKVADRVRSLLAEKSSDKVTGIASVGKRIRNMSYLLDVTQEDTWLFVGWFFLWKTYSFC